MRLIRQLSPLSATLILAAHLGAAADMRDSLLKNSPFGDPAEKVSAAAAAPEFRGYMVEGGERIFSLYDPAQGRSFWLKRDEAGGGLVARKFSEDKLLLEVEYRGRPLALHLVQAKVKLMAAGAPASPSAGAAPIPSGPGAETGAPANESEYERQAKIALERGPQIEAAATQSRENAARLLRAYADRAKGLQ